MPAPVWPAVRDGDRAKASVSFAAAGGEFRRARHFARSWWAWPGRAVPVLVPSCARSTRCRRWEPRRSTSRARRSRVWIPTSSASSTVVSTSRRSRAIRWCSRTRRRRTDDIRRRLADLSGMWLAPPIQHAITRFETVVKSAGDSAHTATDALTLAPSILGRDGPRTYFIAFVTPTEARGSGGLIANYGILRAKDGRIHLDRVGRAPDLDFEGTNPKHLTGLADYQARYNQFDVANTWANVTMSPDFPTVAQVIAQLYPKSGGEKIDGVMEVGPHGMAGLLALSGPIHIAGLPFDLNEHNIVQFLLHDEYTKITDQQQRADLLGDVHEGDVRQAHLRHVEAARPDLEDHQPGGPHASSSRSGCSNTAGERFVDRIGGDGSGAAGRAGRFVRRNDAEPRGQQDRLLPAPDRPLRRAPRRPHRSRRRAGDADAAERRAPRR